MEDIAAARNGVGEHAGGHHGHAEGVGVVPAKKVSADLGYGIGRRRIERSLLIDSVLRDFRRWDLAEHLGGGADMNHRLVVTELLHYEVEALEKPTGSENVGV